VINGLLLTGGLQPAQNVRKPVGGLRRNKVSILNVPRRRSQLSRVSEKTKNVAQASRPRCRRDACATWVWP